MVPLGNGPIVFVRVLISTVFVTVATDNLQEPCCVETSVRVRQKGASDLFGPDPIAKVVAVEAVFLLAFSSASALFHVGQLLRS